MAEHDDRLDDALSEFLEDRNAIHSDLESYLPVLQSLDSLRATPERDNDLLLSNREAFLEFAKSIEGPVSKEPKGRLNGWKTFFGRERKPMTAVLSIALALMLAFGGVGTTAYAAQDSLPTEALYPVKEFTEQVRLALTTNTEAEVELLLDFTEERMGEMVSLANEGEIVPEKTQLRFQEQLQLALAKAAQLGDSELEGALQRIQTMAQNQIRTMTQVQKNIPSDSPCEALQLAIQAMNRVKNEAEDGLADPVTFRLRQGTNRPEDAPDQPVNEPPGKQDSSPNSENGASGPGNGNGSSAENGSQGDGSGDGSGDGGDANGNGYGDGSGDGGGAHGDGDGDGVCDCTCDNPECDCTRECTPQGPENRPDGKGKGN